MANLGLDLSEALSTAIEQHGGSVVRVESGRAGTSGVAWSAEHVLTSHHGLDGDESVEIGLADSSTLKASVIGRDPSTDLALLKVEKPALTAARFADLDGLKVGHLVLALGRPGKTVRATAGIVHALGPTWRTPHGGKLDRYLEADVGLFPGFSGGALIDLNGRVLGVSTAGLWRGRAVAVPTATLKRVTDSLIAHGRIRHGFLGVGVYPVQLPDAVSAQVGQKSGVLIVAVEPGTSADKAGIVQGDVLVAVDGQPVAQPGDLVALLDEERIGREITATIARAGQVQKIALTVGAR